MVDRCFTCRNVYCAHIGEKRFGPMPKLFAMDGAEQQFIQLPLAAGLPKDAAARKAIPIYSGFVAYFPDAMAAVAQLSFIANEQHNPGQPLHWDKSKSADELDAFMRHMVDGIKDPRDCDGVMHAVKEAWRAMANLQRLADSGVNIFAEISPRL